MKLHLEVRAFSWRGEGMSEAVLHECSLEPLPDFWLDWGKSRAMDLYPITPNEAAAKMPRLEASVRFYVEGYAGRIAALTTRCRQVAYRTGSYLYFVNVNHYDVQEDLRAHCEAKLYGPLTPSTTGAARLHP